MDNDELYLYDILTPYDWYLWTVFHDQHPTWKLLSYDDDRVSIESKYGWIRINAVSMEKALETARREMKNKYIGANYLLVWVHI